MMQNYLYAKISGQYQQVSVKREFNYEKWEYVYTYKVGETVIATSTGDSTSPTFTGTDDGYLYVRQWNMGNGYNTNYIYTYYYTNESGEKVTITTSTGANTNVEDKEFYYSYTDPKDSRLATLKTAVTKFTEEVKRKSKGADGIEGTADDVAFSIAVVGFGGDNRYSYTD